MTKGLAKFRVHEPTLRLMLPGMTMAELHRAACAPNNLFLVVIENEVEIREITGEELFSAWNHLCSDYGLKSETI